MSRQDIDHEFTDSIVCPWCGYVDDSSWEYREDSGEVDCPECGKPFHFEREVSVSYTTTKSEGSAT